MSQAAMALALLAAAALYAAAHEYFANNRRDARLLGSLGGGGTLASVAAWLA